MEGFVGLELDPSFGEANRLFLSPSLSHPGLCVLDGCLVGVGLLLNAIVEAILHCT
jgi:hypothetical protein